MTRPCVNTCAMPAGNCSTGPWAVPIRRRDVGLPEPLFRCSVTGRNRPGNAGLAAAFGGGLQDRSPGTEPGHMVVGVAQSAVRQGEAPATDASVELVASPLHRA